MKNVVVTVRGILKAANQDEAQRGHDETVARLSKIGQSLGSTGHQAFLNPENPREFLAMDTWTNMEGLQQFMSDPANPGAAIADLFEGEPDINIWVDSGWSGFE